MAPPPPTPRPLSSAISIQALERIVDSEESLTSDMGPSKPSSDIGAPSKASSDIDCPTVNSDIGIDAKSMRQLDRSKPKPEAAMCEFAREQNCTAEVKPEARSKLDSVSSEHVKAQAIALVEATARVEQARTRRGKLTRTANNLNILLLDSSADSRVGEGANVDEKTLCVRLYPRKHRLSVLKRNRLHAAIQRYRSQYDNSSVNFANDVLIGIAAKNRIQDVTNQLPKICQNSQGFRRIKSNSREYRGKTISSDDRELLANRSSKPANYVKPYAKECDHTNKQLTRTQTLNPDGVKSDVKNVECKVLKNTCNPKVSRSGSYVCRGKYGKRVSACSTSFQNDATSRETELLNFHGKPNLMSSQNLRLKYSKTSSSLELPSYSSKLGRVSATKCYANSIVFTETCNRSESDHTESNQYPPPLSTLQIFALSTKPSIQVRPMESVLSDIDELPSLPIISCTETKSQERKLSILEPPPLGLVSRQESNESWNRFLVQLNLILENRVGEFV